MTVPPATTLSTFAVKTPDGTRIPSIQRSHWWSAGRTHDGASATTAIRAMARARQARPASIQPGDASLSRPPWSSDRLRVSSVPCPGRLIGMAGMNALAGAVVHVAMIVVFFALAGHDLTKAFKLPSGSKILGRAG